MTFKKQPTVGNTFLIEPHHTLELIREMNELACIRRVEEVTANEFTHYLVLNRYTLRKAHGFAD